jgi:hypothetical protein
MDISDWPAGTDLNPVLFRLALKALVQQERRPDILFRLRRRDDDRFMLEINTGWDDVQGFDISGLVAEVGLSPTMCVNALIETTLINAGRADLIECFGRL